MTCLQGNSWLATLKEVCSKLESFLLERLLRIMPEETSTTPASTEALALIGLMAGLETDYASVSKEASERTEANRVYTEIENTRKTAAQRVQTANANFLAAPDDESAIQEFLAALDDFRSMSQNMFELRKSQQKESGEATQAETKYSEQFSAVKDAFNLFLSAHLYSSETPVSSAKEESELY